ncbi:mating-type protein MAT1-2, partial [Apodospora peruviana]
RPPNAFILYRSDKAPLVKIERPLLSNNEISVLIGEMWRNEEDEMRRCYSYAANFIKTRFLHDNPGYRYQ